MTKLLELPTLSKKEIHQLLLKRPLEDTDVLLSIEKFFLKRRGYIFKIPSPKTPVILLLSGGLDTVIIWDILMKKYKLPVYPLFFRRGQIRMPVEERSVDKFAEFYSKRYPHLYHTPKKLTTFIPPLEIRWNITRYGDKPILKDTKELVGIPTYSSLLVDYAVEYAYFLEINRNIKIRNIFCGFMVEDGTFFRYETLTALRTNMYNICNLTNDYSWQFTSLALEKELGFFFKKSVLINWAKNNNIPIEDSSSCIKYSYFHCGECGYCNLRKISFRDSGVVDKTIYINSSKPKIIFKIINKLLLLTITAIFLLRVWIELLKNFLYHLKIRY